MNDGIFPITFNQDDIYIYNIASMQQHVGNVLGAVFNVLFAQL